MKTRYIYVFLAVVLLCSVSAGCSDNLDSDLIPLSSVTRTLTLNGSQENIKLSLSASPTTCTINVESNTRWTVEVIDGGGWCTTDALTGIGNGSFTIKVLDNSGERRSCKVTVAAVNAEGQVDNNKALTKDVEIVQETSNVRLSPSSLESFPAKEVNQSFDIVANVDWTLDVTYETATSPQFVTVSPIENMTDQGEGVYGGTGNARFLITILANGTSARRLAFLNLRSATGDYTVDIVQNKSDYAFDVSPLETRNIGAEGGFLEFGVLSLSSWKARCSDDAVAFTPAEGRGGNERETVKVMIGPNTTKDVRTLIIRFIPDSENYLPQSIEVVQQPFDLTFALSRTGATDVVMENGGNISFELESRFDWTIETPSWIIADNVRGAASISSRTIALSVKPNSSNGNRTGTVTVYPVSTSVGDNAFLEPSSLGIEPVKLTVTQFGGREPAISVPWLGDDYSQTTANVEFNFYSPFYEVVEAGLEWSLEDGTKPGRLTTVPSNRTDCTVSFRLTNLNPATKYVARGYVKDLEGNVKYGNWSFPFTTGGRYPENEHNPTPSN